MARSWGDPESSILRHWSGYGITVVAEILIEPQHSLVHVVIFDRHRHATALDLHHLHRWCCALSKAGDVRALLDDTNNTCRKVGLALEVLHKVLLLFHPQILLLIYLQLFGLLEIHAMKIRSRKGHCVTRNANSTLESFKHKDLGDAST